MTANTSFAVAFARPDTRRTNCCRFAPATGGGAVGCEGDTGGESDTGVATSRTFSSPPLAAFCSPP